MVCCLFLYYCRFGTMRWKFALKLITRSHVLISTHHVSPLSYLHRSSLITHVAHSHCHHTYCCSLNKKLALVNNVPCIMVSRCDFPVPITHVWTRGYAKGKDRGGDKKTDKGIVYTCLIMYQFLKHGLRGRLLWKLVSSSEENVNFPYFNPSHVIEIHNLHSCSKNLCLFSIHISQF